MKALKKFMALTLTVLLVLSLSVAALAAGETGSITVDNPQADQTYTAYKIFDVSYNTDKTAYSYTIQGDSEWFRTVQTYANDASNGLTLTQASGTDNTYVVTTTDAFSAPKFAAALKAAVAGKTGTALTAGEDGTVSTSNLELGYYFVASTSGALCNLTTTNPNVTIHDKNDIPFDKVGNKESVDVGETVTYTITGKVPDYTGFTSYTYLITDEMSEGLTFSKDVKVTVGGTDKTSDCTVTYNVDGNANKFTVSVPVLEKGYSFGAEIKVTYTAVVNEKAVAKVENNKATLTYSNDPTNTESKALTPEDKETVYSAKIVIDKYAANKDNDKDTSKKLAGAQFVLYKLDGETKWYYKWNDTGKKVEWVNSKEAATVKITDDKGAASFDGLADGTYYLEEIAAPAGYNLLKDPVEVKVDGTKAVAAENPDATVLVETKGIANQTGAVLPSTGGVGTTIFYVLGGLLVVGAAVLLVTKKRMSSAK